MELSIVIPVYNNQDTIVKLIQLIDTSLISKINYEVILVDDHSADKSLDVINGIAQNKPQVIVMHNLENIGQHKSILKGFAISKGKYLCTLDADLQDNPAYIIPLYEQIVKGFDAVFLSRQGRYQSSSKMFTSRIYKSLVYKFTGLKTSAGSYFIINRNIFRNLEKYNIRCPYVSILVASVSCSIGYIEGVRDQRVQGKSQYNSWMRLKYGIMGLHCIVQTRIQKKKLLLSNNQ